MAERTKFILHGGNLKVDNQLNRSFIKELVSDLDASDKLLLIFFAYQREQWRKGFAFFKKLFKDFAEQKINFILASHENFLDSVSGAQAIYLHGGNTRLLMDSLKKYPSFKELIKGKTIAGSSAGAYVLSSYYYGNDSDEVDRGLGILPIRTRCHYQGELDLVEMKFSQVPSSLKYDLVLLKDYQYKVSYQ